MRNSQATFRSLLLALFIMATSGPGIASADTGNTESEIDFLVAEIGASDCTFIRNGDEHSAEDAADHLQMKRKRGRRYYDSAEEFIERIASKSSWTGKQYLIRCGAGDTVPTGTWLRERLTEYRDGEAS